MDFELEREILELHEKNFTPQQIAIYLGLRVFEVITVIQDNRKSPSLTEEVELPPIAKCLVNTNCAKRLLDQTLPDEQVMSSLGLVLVARFQDYDYYSICTYLIDYLCLGVKDTMGPQELYHEKLDFVIKNSYQAFSDGYVNITLEEAQAIVLGSVNYAAKLGFKPHENFENTYQYLGRWEQQLHLEFGLQGKPFYINGPYDNFRQIIKTLEKNVGRGNFDYILGVG
ncbi:MAG: DNA-binding response regulator [Kamptonema sp. SIO4C4]|nr:DNA-binding response regulator [Kamptonema sp. SIO4C4]